MVAIVDYGVGNLFSLSRSLRKIGEEPVITSDRKILEEADRIILPGVGAFGDAAEKLSAIGADSLLVSLAKDGKLILGICLGMQLLFEKSYEYGTHKGLGLLGGEIVPIKDKITENLQIPHMGWNELKIVKSNPLCENIKDGDFVYFVHTYMASGCDDSLYAYSPYGTAVPAIVGKGNVYGCQFHPEKSGDVGLGILKSFCDIEAKQ